MPDFLRVEVARAPIDAVVSVPGSKSIANRALVCAALADGRSVLSGVPDGDDTLAMVDCLQRLGVAIERRGDALAVDGAAGRVARRPATVDAGLAGTTSRFVTALAALGTAPITVDGAPPLRARPMHALHEALGALGVGVATVDRPGHLPVTVTGPPGSQHEGSMPEVSMPGDVSSQFVTALMLVGPYLPAGLRLGLSSTLVSRPYVELTAGVMADFGFGDVVVGERLVTVGPGRYRATELRVEPDATSAGYPMAMVAVAGGRIEIVGLTATSRQGDARFADVLASMGCEGRRDRRGCVVARDPARPLTGLDIDMADISDLVPTLAAVAVTASTSTLIRGVGFIRAKESDRLGDLATELAKTGARIAVESGGLRIDPVPALHGARLATHHDHRLAMAFGALGAAVAGIEIEDPDVVAKSWPGFWSARAGLLQ